MTVSIPLPEPSIHDSLDEALGQAFRLAHTGCVPKGVIAIVGKPTLMGKFKLRWLTVHYDNVLWMGIPTGDNLTWIKGDQE